MRKKFVISLVVILLILAGAGGFFWWWHNQADVRELNKNLPAGVKVVKSLLGNEYKIVNKIDGYEFKVPKEWEGIRKIEYTPERDNKDLSAKIASIGIEGKRGYATLFSLDVFTLIQTKINLEKWVDNFWNFLGLEGELKRDKVDNFTVVKAREEKHLGGTYVYFIKNDSKIYVFNSGSEEFIRYIITNGKW